MLREAGNANKLAASGVKTGELMTYNDVQRLWFDVIRYSLGPPVHMPVKGGPLTHSNNRQIVRFSKFSP